MSRRGTVFLVGAGPGDPGLITTRGLDLVRTCDVLIYDNLMADEFVAVSRAAEKIYVGKASGRHMMTQERIGEILVSRAREGKCVVRLKGGDPFVFGRGAEECQALERASVPYVIVPGVTAGLAGPAYAGIPVTHREMSRGVTLVTGHFSGNREVELPWDALAGLGHTLVFYMAVAALERVCRNLLDAGLDGSSPAALLEQATTGSQRCVRGSLCTIVALAAEQGVRPPAILVVGDVVELGEDLAWLAPQPLAGRTVLFTRAADRDYDAVQRLRSLGAKVIDVPVVTVRPRIPDADVERALDALGDVHGIAFTSEAAVRFFFEALAVRSMDTRALADHVVAASTRTVAGALERQGIMNDIDLEEVRAKGFARALGDSGLLGAGRVLVPRSSAAGGGLIEQMRSVGIDPVPLVLYDTDPADLGWLSVKLEARRPDVVAFLSGSGVDAVLDAVPGLAGMEPPVLWACVGGVTASALRRRGLEPDVVPDRPDVDLMVEHVAKKLTSSP